MLTRLREAVPGAWLTKKVQGDDDFRVVPPADRQTPAEPWPAAETRDPFRWVTLFIISLTAIAAATALAFEMRTSWLQARLIPKLLQGASYKVEPGESGEEFRTGQGPYDQRLGYTRLSEMSRRLKQNGFVVEAQARWSERLRQLGHYGMFPIYREKTRAGLRLLDRTGDPLQMSIFPERAFTDFSAIPPLVVRTALYIENREILDGWSVQRNPAIEWDRLGKAVVDYGAKKVTGTHQMSGGSTLATQLEKVRHSPGGRTETIRDKLRQMASASLRAYYEGPNTLPARQRIVLDYLNSVPLAATAAHGEVIGLADALYDWYGADFQEVCRLLSLPEDALTRRQERERAAAYRQVLSLLLAINRPTYYLRHHASDLAERTDGYLRRLAADGFISDRLRDVALATPVRLKPSEGLPPRSIELARKASDAARYSMVGALGLDSLYELDRLDLTVETTLHGKASRIAAAILSQLDDPEFAEKAGLVGDKMLSPGQGSPVVYTLSLYERDGKGNRLVTQLDNTHNALNLNEGSKLELGSTAKLRTLATYLEIITELRAQLVDGKDRDKLPMQEPDRLTRWAAEYLLHGGDPELPAMLEAAMNRVYSASPGEAFFTGGGLHAFANFDGRDNGREMTVREGIRRSVNLVFIRLMRDIVDYYLRRTPTYDPAIFHDETHPARAKLLARFADREGTAFLRNYFDRYMEMTPDEQLETLFAQRELSPTRFAVMYRSVRPGASLGEFQLAMQAYITQDVPERRVLELYDRYGPGKFDWNDRGYVAGIHPLELWLVSFLGGNPDATWEQVRDASASMRQEVYRWLMKSRYKHAQDTRIRTVLESDAFQLVYLSWKRQGFPFRSMVPSLASAIGSSGDTPAALADLAGIILNGGVKLPNRRLERYRFAEGTPFETRLTRKMQEPLVVMDPAVAEQLHREMLGVVQYGTAGRAFRSVTGARNQVLDVAGKTGTGDNRIKTLHEVGKARNRTAAFVFTVGDRYFGSIVAYVPGEQAEAYRFSSALPVAVFKLIVPKVVKELELERAARK
ncbi:MAG: transglycosylase domain-containing protein [Acidobacteria bacterium]|nr:transglycosylase domain-containing protein [Acidobacteriota bacterium]